MIFDCRIEIETIFQFIAHYSGQIPSILYHVVNQEAKLPTINIDPDPVHKVSQQFANSVTKDCFHSLITLLKWSWGTFKLTLNDLKDKVSFEFKKIHSRIFSEL